MKLASCWPTRGAKNHAKNLKMALLRWSKRRSPEHAVAYLLIVLHLNTCSPTRFPSAPMSEFEHGTTSLDESCEEDLPDGQQVMELMTRTEENKHDNDWTHLEMDQHEFRKKMEKMMMYSEIVGDQIESKTAPGDHYEINGANQDDCDKTSLNMAYDMVEHGIRFDAPQQMMRDSDQRRKIPAPIMIEPVVQKKVDAYSFMNQDDILAARRKHLQSKFHLKNLEQIFNSPAPKHLEPVVSKPEIITARKMLPAQPESQEKVTQNIERDHPELVVQDKLGAQDVSELDQQTYLDLKDSTKLIETAPGNHWNTQQRLAPKTESKNDQSGFDEVNTNSATDRMAKPFFGNSSRVRESLARAADIARNLQMTDSASSI